MADDDVMSLLLQVKQQVTELQALVVERDATIHRLRLAEALSQWKPPRKRAGAPKRIDAADDLDLLLRLEAIQAEFGLKSRAQALDFMIARGQEIRRAQGYPRLNAVRLRQQRKTLLTRLAAVSKQRPDN